MRRAPFREFGAAYSIKLRSDPPPPEHFFFFLCIFLHTFSHSFTSCILSFLCSRTVQILFPPFFFPSSSTEGGGAQRARLRHQGGNGSHETVGRARHRHARIRQQRMAQTMVLLDLWMGGAGVCWLFALSVTSIAFKRKHATTSPKWRLFLSSCCSFFFHEFDRLFHVFLISRLVVFSSAGTWCAARTSYTRTKAR